MEQLNTAGYRSKTGRRFSKDLQNRTYLGYVKYQPYVRNSDGSRSYRGVIEWFEGKHSAVLSKSLFDKCQEVRASRRPKQSRSWQHKRIYLLSDLVYCAECMENIPKENKNNEYGKMRCQSNGKYFYYRCRARDFSQVCSQTSARAEDLELQVVRILKHLKPPDNWNDTLVATMGQLLGERSLEQRISEIKEIIERMDFRWDNGFFNNQNKYMQKRVELQRELEKLTPIPQDDLERAVDILENFTSHWEVIEHDRKAQKTLLRLILSRVWVRKGKVIAVSLRPNYHVILGLESEKPTEFSMDLTGDKPVVHERERRDLNPRSPP